MIVMSIGGFFIFAILMMIGNNESKFDDYL